MERKNRVSYPLGMFDLFKGVGMILVMMNHATPWTTVPTWLNFFVTGTWAACLMGGFYAINGFQFRPAASIKQSVKKYAKAYLSMYLHIAVGAVGLLLFINPYEALQYVMGFLLGNLCDIQIGSYTLVYTAMGWFLLTLFWASILMDIVLKIRNKVFRIACITVLALLGVYLELNSITFYCICRALSALPSVYIGYCMYTGEWLTKLETSGKKVVPYLLFAVTIPLCIWYFYGPKWVMYLTIICEMVFGCMVICFSRDTIQASNRLMELLRKVGRYTPRIIIVHSVEMICIKWWGVVARLQFISSDTLRYFVLFGLKSIVVFLGCILMGKLDRWEKQWKRKKRAQKRAQRKATA